MDLIWWIIIMGTVIAMITSFITLFCGCCRKSRRDELLDISGVVKITNLDDSIRNNDPVALSIVKTPLDENIPTTNTSSGTNSIKRPNGISNTVGNPGSATRSLPEIPIDNTASSSNRNNEVSSNFVSYSGDTNSELYATLDVHKIKEHHYAQVDDNATASTSRADYIALDRRNSVAEDEVDAVPNIPAASAIAGSVAASNDLPYMTPPIHANHFSGDSQDSTKGYTSITVREPLSHIRPQNPMNQESADSHYTVLSDDSDEMYAAIQDAYTSGSDTYAQIQPVNSNATYSVVPETSNEVGTSQRYSVASSVHSRQASTSSVTSTLTSRNSPKEKRQANSPLPKPPDLTPDDMYAKVLKKRKSESDWCNNRDSVFLADSDPLSSLSFHPGPSNVVDVSTLKPEHEFYNNDVDNIDKDACGYEILPERNYELLAEVNQSAGYETVKETDSNVGYESLPEPDSLTPGYERIREPSNYEKIKTEDELDPNYEELKPKVNEPFHCYATIHKDRVPSENVTEPDYASLTRHGDVDDSFYERINKDSMADGDQDSFNDNNNNHSAKLAKNEIQETRSNENLSDLYSKVNKNVKR